MSTSVKAIASRAIAIATTATLILATTVTALTSAELDDRMVRAWNDEPELLAEVYAEDGVHTATFYDRTNEYIGPDAIEGVARYGTIEPIGPRIDIPAADGELRWATFVTLGGGSACLFHAIGDRIVRHDCVVPEASTDNQPAAGLAGPEASGEIDEIVERLRDAWDPSTDVELLAGVYAPDAVHSARYLDTTREYTGPAEIRTVAGFGGAITPIGERIDFLAPQGELAWAEVSDVAGGSVCLFRAVEGMVTRHDCVLPISG